MRGSAVSVGLSDGPVSWRSCPRRGPGGEACSRSVGARAPGARPGLGSPDSRRARERGPRLTTGRQTTTGHPHTASRTRSRVWLPLTPAHSCHPSSKQSVLSSAIVLAPTSPCPGPSPQEQRHSLVPRTRTSRSQEQPPLSPRLTPLSLARHANFPTSCRSDRDPSEGRTGALA